MKFINNLTLKVTNVLGLIASLVVILLVVHVTADVVMRNVFGAPLTGTIEVVSMVYMIGICFLPLALADRRDAHIAVEVLAELMPDRVVRFLIVMGLVITIVVMIALCWRTWLEAMTQYRKGAVMIVAGREPMRTWPSYFVLPVGFGLSALVCTVKLLGILKGRPLPADTDLPAGMEIAAGMGERHD